MRGQSTVGEGLSWGEFCVCCVEVLELKKKYPVNGDESGADRCVCVHRLKRKGIGNERASLCKKVETLCVIFRAREYFRG